MVMEKMFIRLQSMPDPTTVRPEKVLVKWAERLQVCDCCLGLHTRGEKIGFLRFASEGYAFYIRPLL